MNFVHQILVAVPSLKKARAEAFAQLSRFKHEVAIADKRIPAGKAGATTYGTAEFFHSLQTVRMLQASSLQNVYTMLASIFGLATAKDFEELYLNQPNDFKRVLADAFRFMGECAADALLDRRVPKAIPGEDWKRGDFDSEGFQHGLEEMCKLKKLLAGDYFKESYFLNSLTGSGFVAEDEELQELALQAKENGLMLALVPVSIGQ